MKKKMSQENIHVLLLGESEMGSAYLARRLEQLGCQSWFARTTEESLALSNGHEFRLFLSTKPLQRNCPVVARLSASGCDIFYCYPVEEGCWWLPLRVDGRDCLGSPALRPSEFMGLLDQVVQRIRTSETKAGRSNDSIPGAHSSVRDVERTLGSRHAFSRPAEKVAGSEAA